MVSYEDVEAAARRLAGIAHRTPVATSRLLDEACRSRVFLKCENLQRAGAFKFRGAYNAISRLDDTEKARGVITYSSGNHAQAVALVCRLLGVSATVVMPVAAPSTKIEATRAYGASVTLYEPAGRSREEIVHDIAAERELVVVPPFDDPAIIAGQGTAALELFQETGDLDCLLVPCGGGGLLSGSAIAADHLSPGCRVIGVEPEAGDDATRSFRSGTLQTVQNPETIADGARTSSLGRHTFPLICHHVDDMQTVSDEDLIRTMRFVWTRLKLVVEPTGVLGLAAIFNGRITCRERRVGVILSGGNVDFAGALRWFAG
jgi:threonine dehydratase